MEEYQWKDWAQPSRETRSLLAESSLSSNYTELMHDDGSVLSRADKLIYKQWQMDKTDVLLIDGYFRRAITSQQLPSEVRQIIISYYFKKYSKLQLRKLINSKQRDIKQREKIYKKRKDMCLTVMCCIPLMLIFISLFVAPDIAGFVVNHFNDCNIEINAVSFGVDKFLLYGCGTHFAASIIIYSVVVGFMCVAENTKILRDRFEYPTSIVLCFTLGMEALFFSWGIAGFVMYSQIDMKNSSEKACANMVLAWGILKILECIAIPFLLFVWFLSYIPTVNLPNVDRYTARKTRNEFAE
eukprot:174292_1